jgi:hypothetical protein
MHRSGAALLIVSILLGAHGASADDQVFGPSRFLRTKGKPDLYTDTFSGAHREGIIRVVNGDPDGDQRISSAIIRVNQRRVFGPRDFSQEVESVAAEIDLEEDNTIAVELRGGGPGSYLTVEVQLPFVEEVPAWRMPELAVTGLTVTPERSDAGDAVTLTATVSNTGKGITPSATLVFFVDGAEISRHAVGALLRGGEAVFEVTWEAEGPGRHPVRAELELEPGTFDGSLSNNFETALARVSGEPIPRPELEFASIGFDALQLVPGESGDLSFKVRNPSFAHIDHVPVLTLIDGRVALCSVDDPGPVESSAARSPDASDDRIPRCDLTDFGPGEERTLRIHWEAITLGEHIVQVQVPDFSPEPEFGIAAGWLLSLANHTVLYDTPAKDKWASIGPRILDNQWVGRMAALAFDPTDPNVIYAGSREFEMRIPSGAGVWKTQDAGGSWSAKGDKMPSMQVGAVAVDPRHPSIVYAGTPKGIFKSRDNGHTWWHFATPKIIEDVRALVIRYAEAGDVMIYTGTACWNTPGYSPHPNSPTCGLFRYKSGDPFAAHSEDWEWDRIKRGHIKDLAVHPSESSTVFITVRGEGVFRTEIGENAKVEATAGDHDFTSLTDGLPSNTNSVTLDIHELYPDVVYAGASSPESGVHFGIYRSEDGGDHWETVEEYPSGFLDEAANCTCYNPYIRVVPLPATEDPYYGSIRTEIIYFGGQCLYQLVNYRLLTADSTVPTSWPARGTRMVSGYFVPKQAGVDMKKLEFDPASPATHYYVASDQGIFYCRVDSTPSGGLENKQYAKSGDQCFHRNRGLRVTQFYDFDVHDQNLIVGGTQDTGTILYKGVDLWEFIKEGDGLHSQINPYDPNIIYAQEQSLSTTTRWNHEEQRWQARGFRDLPTGYGYDAAWMVVDDPSRWSDHARRSEHAGPFI